MSKTLFPEDLDAQSADSPRVLLPIDTSALIAFRRSLLSSRRPSHFHLTQFNQNKPSEQPKNLRKQDYDDKIGQELSYPFVLPFNLPELPPADILNQGVGFYAHRFAEYTPFLCGLHVEQSFEQTQEQRLQVMVLSATALGALVSLDHGLAAWGPRLWRAASQMHLAMYEMDHQMTWRGEWVVSSLLLTTYGIMHADGTLWSQLSTWSGQAETVARCFALKIASTGDVATEDEDEGGLSHKEELPRILGYCFLVDVLKSIMLDLPSSLRCVDLTMRLSTGQRFNDVYYNQLFRTHSLPSDLHGEDHILILLAILSEIVHLHRWLGPLVDVQLRNEGYSNTPDPALLLKVDHQKDHKHLTDALRQPRNIFVPFSANAEWMRITKNIQDALQTWAQVAGLNEPEPGDDIDQVIPHEIIALHYFCRLLLSGGPDLLALPQQLGYSPDCNFQARAQHAHLSMPHVSDETITLSWKILELLNHSHEPRGRGKEKPSVTPLWMPIVALYAGLAVWASLQGPSQSSVTGPRTPKLLKLFELELREMTWPCAKTMADLLKGLIRKDV